MDRPNALIRTSMAELRDIVDSAMLDLKSAIQQGMAERGKNATGKTSQNIRTFTVGGGGMVQGSLEADYTWKWVGNGRGPGGVPPVAPLRAWIKLKGLDINEYVLAIRIAIEGTRDFRLKRRNIFLEEIEGWEKSKMPKVEDAAAQNLMDRTEQIILRS